MENKENFKAIKWIREVRDKNTLKYKNLNLKEFALKLSNDAKESSIWERVLKNKKIIQ